MNIEQKVKEERIAEASKKNMSKKLALIARMMGQEMRVVGERGIDGSGFEQSFIDPYSYEEEDDNYIPISEESSEVVGWHFDALPFGANIQIMCHADGHQIKASYDGTVVYEEVQGDLQRYLPHDCWESRIEHWAIKSEKKRKEKEESIKQMDIVKGKSKLAEILANLAKNWGFKY